jgi:hypothetical protein
MASGVIGILIEALAALPQLLEFTWVGRFPPLRQDVVNGLASSCRHLMHLSVESVEVLYVHGPKVDPYFREPLLVRFGFTRLTSISWGIGDMGNAYPGPFEALVAANLESLRSIATHSQILDHLPVRSFEGLHHLEIRQKEGHQMEASTQLALRHCPQLESLVLRDFFNTDIADIVASACGRLPSLRSFAALRSPKLNPYEGVLLDYARKLISFLAPIPNLRRLHLHIPATYELPGAASSVLTDLLRDIGKHCPRLEALGLGLSAMDDILLFEALAASLPLSLRAVSLSLRGNPLESTSSTPLVRYQYHTAQRRYDTPPSARATRGAAPPCLPSHRLGYSLAACVKSLPRETCARHARPPGYHPGQWNTERVGYLPHRRKSRRQGEARTLAAQQARAPLRGGSSAWNRGRRVACAAYDWALFLDILRDVWPLCNIVLLNMLKSRAFT